MLEIFFWWAGLSTLAAAIGVATDDDMEPGEICLLVLVWPLLAWALVIGTLAGVIIWARRKLA